MNTAIVAIEAYPVIVTVDSRLEGHDRLTTLLRPVLAIPHTILVGPGGWLHRLDSAGLIGAAAYLLAIVNWFAIVITGESLGGIRDFQLYYLRWRTRAVAYLALLVDPYPPFGDGEYAASVIVSTPEVRDRVTVAARLLLVIPHLAVLTVLVIGWGLATLVAWLAILFTGRYPAALHPFAIGVMRWLLRVEAYSLLLVDEYPPFAFE